MAWLSVFVALVTVLAVCRITRLITEDTITAPLRLRIARLSAPGRPAARPGGRPPGRAWEWLDKLVNCPWCAGFWVSCAAAVAYMRCWLGYWPHNPPTWFAVAVAALATSWASALLADWLDSPPPVRPIRVDGDLVLHQPPVIPPARHP